MTDPKAALQELSARGITTLEQFVESKARMQKPLRIDSEKAFQEMLARSAVPSDSSIKSKIGPPDPSVTIVLDGKRVEYNEIARLNGQPLDYVATRLKGGEQALVVFSDRSILRNHTLRQFKGPLQGIATEVDNALLASGLQASSTVASIDFGVQICEDINYGGATWTFAPEEYVPRLSQFDEGLGLFGGDWNDKISSIRMGQCWCENWADRDRGGDYLPLWEDTPNLHILGWGDRISSIYTHRRSG